MPTARVRQLFQLATLLSVCCWFIVGCDNQPSDTSQEDGSVDFSASLTIVGNTDGLNGHMLFLEQRGQPNFRIAELNLDTQEINTVFAVPKNGWVYSFSASPDHTQLALAYSAPPNASQDPLSKSGIYLLDLSTPDAVPQHIIGDDQTNTFYFQPSWSADGHEIYFTLSIREGDHETLSIERFDLQTSQMDTITESAVWPMGSAIASQVMYLAVNPETRVRSLILNTDDALRTIVPEYGLYDLDLPVFTPNGQAVFLAVIRAPDAPTSWLDHLFPAAYAHDKHDLPADWWLIALDGGAPHKLADVGLILYQGVFSPTGEQFAFASAQGLHVMNQDGDRLQLLLQSRAIRALAWLP
jgi:Tol biopolymer transport system component